MSTRFEALLAAHLVLALAGCSGGGSGGGSGTTESGNTGDSSPTGPTGSLAAWCAGTLPTGYFAASGYVAVDLGASCPDAADATTLGHSNCCPTPISHGACAFVRKDENQVSDGYAGWFDAGGSSSYPGFGDPRDVCWYDGVFEDDPDGACCGRPLLRDGRPVLAGVGERPDWLGSPTPDAASLPDKVRQQVGAYWLSAARMEHASVASFARFTLELVRFGAPPELLVDAQRAGLDEVEHARLCFALASAYLGSELGPTPVELGEAATLAPSRIAFAEAVVREGCVGETLAVLDAAARLVSTTDPAVRGVLETILADESRHAALAWKTVAWLLTDDDGTLAAHIEGVLASERARLREVADELVPTGHGLVSEAKRMAALLDGFDRVVSPAWTELRES